MIPPPPLSSLSLSLSLFLSLSSGAVAVGLAHYGQGAGPIVLDNVACSGLETYITDCQNNGYYVHNCAHAEDAGVQCPGTIIILLIIHCLCLCVCVLTCMYVFSLSCFNSSS